MQFFKILILCMFVAVLPSCIASSKHLKQLDRIVEAQSEQGTQIVQVLVAKELVTPEQGAIMVKNASIIETAAHNQATEKASVWTWQVFSWAGFILVVQKIGELASSIPATGWLGVGLSGLGIGITWLLKNNQKIKEIAENDVWHTQDKEKLIATVLTPKDSTEAYDKNKEIAKVIVAKHDAEEVTKETV